MISDQNNNTQGTQWYLSGQWYSISLVIRQILSGLITFVIITVNWSEDYFDNNLRQSGVHKARQQLQLAGDFSRERWAADTRVSLFRQLPLFFVHWIKTELVKISKKKAASVVLWSVQGPSLAWAAWPPVTAGAAQTTTLGTGLDTGHSALRGGTRNFTSCAASLLHRFRPKTRCKDSLLVPLFTQCNSCNKMPKALSLPNNHIS